MGASENKDEIQAVAIGLTQEAHELLSETIRATEPADERAKRKGVSWTDRHRLHVLLEAAEETLRALPEGVVAPWYLAELMATLNAVRKWREKRCWQDIEKSLKDPRTFAHTIAMLHVAELLERGGHRVEVVPRGEKASPDLILRAIGTQDIVVIECYQPSTLCDKPSDFSTEEARKIVEKAMAKAKRQIGTKTLGILAICGYNQSSVRQEILRQAVESRLSETSRPNLCGIWLITIGVLLSEDKGKRSFSQILSAKFIQNPSYFGRVDVVEEMPTNRPDYIESPLRDIRAVRSTSGNVKLVTTTNTRSVPIKQRVIRTKVRILSIIEKPETLTRTVVHGTGNKVPPLFVGKGNIDYHCGQCNAVLAKYAWILSISNIVVECPVCHSYSEFPALPHADYYTVLMTKGNYNFSDAVKLKSGACIVGQ